MLSMTARRSSDVEETLGVRVELSALDTTTYWSTMEQDAARSIALAGARTTMMQ